MNYRLREGVARVSICGAMLLVPSRAASEFCPGVMRINFTQRAIWMTLEKGQTMDDVAKVLSALYLKQPEDIWPKLQSEIDKLVSYGFLIAEEDQHAEA